MEKFSGAMPFAIMTVLFFSMWLRTPKSDTEQYFGTISKKSFYVFATILMGLLTALAIYRGITYA